MAIDINDVSPKFVDWARDHGVNIEATEDWLPWYECWLTGYTEGVEEIKALIREK